MKSGMQWPIGIAIILAVGVVSNVVMMRIANSDPSFAVEPDYYQKAVDFDSTLAHENASLTLRWTSNTTIGRDEHSDSMVVTISLRDSLGSAIEHASVAIEALPVARANDVLTATLMEQSPGVYVTPLPLPRGGLWDVTIHATRNAEHYVNTTRVDVDRPAQKSVTPAVDSDIR